MATRASQYRSVGPALVEHRTAPRHLVAVSRATARRHGELPADAILLDLSIYGCRIAYADRRAPGERLWLRLAGGTPVAATVVWCEDGLLGCRFDTPIPRQTVRALTLVIV